MIYGKLALAEDGSTHERTSLQFYASIRISEIKETYAIDKDGYASTLTAKVGSVSDSPVSFTAFSEEE